MNPLLRIHLRASRALPQASMRWSNPATWGGTLPAAGDSPLISSSIIWDVASTPALGQVRIAAGGRLVADPTMNVGMTLSDLVIDMGGVHQIGTSALVPYTGTATINLVGARTVHTDRPSVNGIRQGMTNSGYGRSVNNMGSRLWYGKPRIQHLTKLKATANAGVASITVRGDCTDWLAGDNIVIAPTNYYGQSTSERRVLTANGVSDGAGGTTLTFTGSPLGEKHYGLKNYPIDAAYGTNAMSLTPGTFTSAAAVPTEIDLSAEVINVSAGNIVVQAPNDSDWSTQGWGVHTMDHPGSLYNDSAVRVVRGGQRGAMGRYPFHAHRMSYVDKASAVTITLNAGSTIINWPNHGITPTTPRISTVTFTTAAFGGIHVSWPGSEAFLKLDQGINFTGASLPTGIVAGTVYYVLLAGGDAPGTFYLSTAKNGGNFTSSLVLFTDAGSGTITANGTEYFQPVVITTTGTLPTGLVAGQTYWTVGSSITASSFSLCTIDDSTFRQTVRAAIIATGTQSGTHAGKLTQLTVDRTDCYRRSCVVDTSENRAFTTHATCGVEQSSCIGFDIKGMANFMENGSEERCLIQDNFMLKVSNPAPADALKLFDIGGEPAGNGAIFSFSSGHWFVNMNNRLLRNTAADCAGFAVWNSLALHCFGESALVAINPNTTALLQWDGNGGHSNGKRGMVTGIGVGDETGTTNGPSQSGGYTAPVPALMSNGFSWKNRQGGYSNTETNAKLQSWWVADNLGGDFEGSTEGDSRMSFALLVGQSLNDAQLAPIVSDFDGTTLTPKFGVASYHYTWIIDNCTFQNYAYAEGLYKRQGQQDYGGGAFSTRDLYTLPMDLQYQYLTAFNVNNSHPGFLSRSPRYAGYPIAGVTLANPCVIDFTGSGMNPELNGKIIFTRTSGVLPSAFALDTYYYLTNVVGMTAQVALTVGGASISTAAQTQSGVHEVQIMWHQGDVTSLMNFNIASVRYDKWGTYGKGATGATARYVTHNRPYFTDGAANVFYPDPTGKQRIISTTTPFVGFASFMNELHTSNIPNLGIKSELINSSTETVIDNFQVDAPDAIAFFGGWSHVCLQDGRRFRITHPAYPTARVAYACRIIGDYLLAAGILLELPWDGTVAVGRVARFANFGESALGNLPDITATAADGSAVFCTAATGATRAAKIAAVAAGNGALYFQDTAANSVFVFHKTVPRPTGSSTASLPQINGEKANLSSYITIRA